MVTIWLHKFSLRGRRRSGRVRENSRGFLLRNWGRGRGRLTGWLRLRLSGRLGRWLLDRGGFGGRNGGNRLGFADIILNSIFLEEPEDVVENKVTIWLFCKEESLDELSPGITMIGHLADDLNDDTTIGRGLRIYGVNEDFAVLETDGGDLVVDFLSKCHVSKRQIARRRRKKYLLAETGFEFLSLCAMNEGGGFGVEAMQTIGLFVDIRVILRNELPSNLGRNDILMNCRWSRHDEGNAKGCRSGDGGQEEVQKNEIDCIPMKKGNKWMCVCVREEVYRLQRTEAN